MRSFREVSPGAKLSALLTAVQVVPLSLLTSSPGPKSLLRLALRAVRKGVKLIEEAAALDRLTVTSAKPADSGTVTLETAIRMRSSSRLVLSVTGVGPAAGGASGNLVPVPLSTRVATPVAERDAPLV